MWYRFSNALFIYYYYYLFIYLYFFIIILKNMPVFTYLAELGLSYGI